MIKKTLDDDDMFGFNSLYQSIYCYNKARSDELDFDTSLVASAKFNYQLNHDKKRVVLAINFDLLMDETFEHQWILMEHLLLLSLGSSAMDNKRALMIELVGASQFHHGRRRQLARVETAGEHTEQC